mmetsp:Transcript_84010/g.233986  ORF Transcript_84010/g.233986 Transcript_84010/m.233986 type:complete len:242 (-) Transcript_84010:365-1090(-)
MPCSFRGGRCASSLRRPLLPADLVSWCILHPDSLQCPPWVALRRLRPSTREAQPQASPRPRCKTLGRRLASCARGLPNFSRTLLRTSSVAAAAAPTAASDHCEETLPLAWGLPQAPEVGSASPCHTPGAPARRPPPRRTDTVVATTPPQTAMRASRRPPARRAATQQRPEGRYASAWRCRLRRGALGAASRNCARPSSKAKAVSPQPALLSSPRTLSGVPSWSLPRWAGGWAPPPHAAESR